MRSRRPFDLLPQNGAGTHQDCWTYSIIRSNTDQDPQGKDLSFRSPAVAVDSVGFADTELERRLRSERRAGPVSEAFDEAETAE